MNVRVEVQLDSSPTAIHKQVMRVAAKDLTDNKNSIEVYISKRGDNVIIAEFTITKARQVDVVDKIGKRFHYIENYTDSSISFPKRATRKKPPLKSYTPKQGQYLAFLYYYTKVNGYPPAERDMQKYFKATPPTVHAMILGLEKKHLIERIPNQPRNIRLLLTREEIPDLD